MVSHSLRLRAALSSRPVHSPMSSSSRPSSTRTLEAECQGDGGGGLAGALQRRGVDGGDAGALGASAPARDRTRCRRRPLAVAAATPLAAPSPAGTAAPRGRGPCRRCGRRPRRPGAGRRRTGAGRGPGPGSSWPVVVVAPWRTSSTTVAAGARRRVPGRRSVRRPASGRWPARRWLRSARGIAAPTYRRAAWMTCAEPRALEAEVVALPGLPPPGGLARAGGAPRSGRRSATRSTGPGPSPASATPPPGSCLVGLAPAAHGANRTGRMFTGDRSGDFLYAALWRTGLRQPAHLACTATTGWR